jgi:hypothetical protein
LWGVAPNTLYTLIVKCYYSTQEGKIMCKTDLNISLSSLLEMSPNLGLKFFDFSYQRAGQDQAFLNKIQEKSTLNVNEKDINQKFFWGSFDFSLYEKNGETLFNFLEFNGTAMAYLTALKLEYTETIYNQLADLSLAINDKVPIIMHPYFTKLNQCNAPTSAFFQGKL